ncbi:MAG: MBL fold metallo-hydrolase [Candidatus Nanohaloarchaea archaeon]
MEFKDFRVFWDGHASVRVADNGFTVAVDPFSSSFTDYEADIVLVTHRDVGHYDVDALEEVQGERTVFVFPHSFDDVPFKDAEFLKAGETIDIYGVEIEAVHMYNDEHVRGEGRGYRFSMADKSFYVAGDTGLTEEMRDLENRVDLAFLPVEGEYTMDVQEAVRAAVRVKPGIAVPYHYGEPFFAEKEMNAQEFKAELEDRNIKCRILDRE